MAFSKEVTTKANPSIHLVDNHESGGHAQNAIVQTKVNANSKKHNVISSISKTKPPKKCGQQLSMRYQHVATHVSCVPTKKSNGKASCDIGTIGTFFLFFKLINCI
jgi:hypothetical protein